MVVIEPSPNGSQPWTVVFDGGSLGNPGRGYGSYAIFGPGHKALHEALDYHSLGDRVTNNQAEYLTLIAALERLRAELGDEAPRSRVKILGDSQLVIAQLRGQWKVRHPGLKPLHDRAAQLLRAFGHVDVSWQPRKETVRLLGH